LIPLDNIQGFPIALMAGSEDKLGHIKDVRWLKFLLSEQGSVCFYQEYKFGHLSFLLPNNFKHVEDMVELVQHYNPSYVSAATDEERATA
jgi:hypothetical protein